MPDIGVSEPVIWFLLGSFLVVAEFLTPGVVIIFFGLAAWIVAATTALELTPSTTAQVLLFSIASVLLLATLRRYVKTWFVGDSENTGGELDEYVGREAVALDDLTPGLVGKVEFKGAVWRGLTQEAITHKARVIIRRRDGLTLHVAPYPQDS